MARWCREQGLAASRLNYWNKQILETRVRTSPETGFIPVVPAADSCVRLLHESGWCLELRMGFDPRVLRSVVEALS